MQKLLFERNIQFTEKDWRALRDNDSGISRLTDALEDFIREGRPDIRMHFRTAPAPRTLVVTIVEGWDD